jgi:hypothetical protein
LAAELDIDESFPRSFEVERLLDLPNSQRTALIYLPASSTSGGPILRVTRRERDRFLVVVRSESDGFKIYTWPDSDKMLASPSAWLIDTINPEHSVLLDGFDGHSLHYVFPIAPGSIIVGHCCGLYCYGSIGLLWKAEDLFCCTDPILTVHGQTLIVLAHKHGVDPDQMPTPKRLNLHTGERERA